MELELYIINSSTVRTSASCNFFIHDSPSLATIHHPLIPSLLRSSPTLLTIHLSFGRSLLLTPSCLHSIILLVNSFSSILFTCPVILLFILYYFILYLVIYQIETAPHYIAIPLILFLALLQVLKYHISTCDNDHVWQPYIRMNPINVS